MNAVLDAAIRLSVRVPVFPCMASKKPACPHGFKDATQDAAAVVDLWTRFPGPLIGIRTGDASGIDVLDIDPIHGGDAWLAVSCDALPITRTHHTRSGGRHILFRHVDGVKNSTSKIAPGVDTRGEGGYIIAWNAHGCQVDNPSVIGDWPRWLLRILMPPKRRFAPPPKPATKAEANSRSDLMIERAYNRVRNAQPGERHAQLRAAAATLGGLARFLDKSESATMRDLVTLIMATGAEDQENAEKTAKWAMDRGSASPLLAGR